MESKIGDDRRKALSELSTYVLERIQRRSQ